MNQFPDSEDHRRLRAALTAMGREDTGGTPAHVEAALLAQLRRRRSSRAKLLNWAVPLAAAALLLLAAAVSEQPAPPMATVAIVAPGPETPSPSRLEMPAPAPARKAIPRRPALVQRVQAAEQPAATHDEFVAVGAWQSIEPIERGSIVRVRMSNSALPGFGIPVSAERWNESVPADVMLAEDGSIRAVRFISTKH